MLFLQTLCCDSYCSRYNRDEYQTLVHYYNVTLKICAMENLICASTCLNRTLQKCIGFIYGGTTMQEKYNQRTILLQVTIVVLACFSSAAHCSLKLLHWRCPPRNNPVSKLCMVLYMCITVDMVTTIIEDKVIVTIGKLYLQGVKTLC